MKLPLHKTKIVCTIGPASRKPRVLEALFRQGMNVARLNFSHGNFEDRVSDIKAIRAAARKTGKACSILADLPGPKIRVGQLPVEPLLLTKGEEVTLTTGKSSSPDVIPVDYKSLCRSVKKGGTIYLSDGFLQLHVLSLTARDVRCRVVVGGKLFSHKGLNLPGAKIYGQTVTQRDLEIVEFGLKHGISIFAVSFVEKGADLKKIRDFARKKGKAVRLVAKIERSEGMDNFYDILAQADAVMVARGDLGVQIPLEDIPVAQKWLIHETKLTGKPVITATQMLASMTDNIRPTRAEATDVANAIVDGTDAVMLSEETAVGKYPVEAVATMARIAESMERRYRPFKFSRHLMEHFKKDSASGKTSVEDMVSLNVVEAMRALGARHILTPTENGSTARLVARFKPDSWIMAFSPHEDTHEFLSLSYGVMPCPGVTRKRNGWQGPVMAFVEKQGLGRKGEKFIFTEGASNSETGSTNTVKFIIKE
jgi:pyruvate kinase